jgi:hypothetical protein
VGACRRILDGNVAGSVNEANRSAPRLRVMRRRADS